MTRGGRFTAALAVAGLAVAACRAGDGGPDAGPTTTTAPTASTARTGSTAPTTTGDGADGGGWSITETGTGLSVDAGGYSWTAATAEGLDLSVQAAGEVVVADTGGLFVVRDGEPRHVAAVTDRVTADAGGTETTAEAGAEIDGAVTADHVSFAVTFDDASTGVVEVGAEGPGGHEVRLRLDDPSGVTAWGAELGLADGERIYGLTERIVDDVVASEIVPAEVGSLDRRGEAVTMWVTPTMSGYVPFHQSSQGYGLLVEGFMPGTYAVGAPDDPGTLAFTFEWDPGEQAGAYHLFVGPDHASILEGYYRATGFPARPPDSAFLHWRGRDEYPVGPPAEVDGTPMNASVASDLEAYATYGLPAGVYHFDRPWAVGPEGFGELAFDPERFPEAEAMLATLDAQGWHTMVWMAPWAIGARGEAAAANGWLAPASPRALDLTDPDAVAWLRDDVTTFLDSPEGRHVDGFFLDRGDEPDVTSTPDATYADGRTGRQIHNWYPVAYARIFGEILEAARGDGGLLIMRPGYTGSQQHVMRWGGDTHSREGLAIPEVPIGTAPSTDLGLRSVLISMQRAAFMGTPYWGSDIGGYTAWVDPEVYARWIEVGFASPLMRFHGMGGTPWATTVTGEADPALIAIYRRYVTLRHDPVVQTYLADAAEEAATSGRPMVRPLVFVWPDQAGAVDRWDQWLLGPDLLVAPVWQSGARQRRVWIPPGDWVDFWDPTSTVEGPKEITVEVPLDVLPLWVRPGSPLLEVAEAGLGPCGP